MYHHTQSGKIVPLATAAAVAAAVYAAARFGSHTVLLLVVVVAVLGLIAFSSMTVQVDHTRLAFWFGPGWIRRSFPLSEIRAWSAVRNPWWYGWGIHLTPHGWLYNIAGRRAVQLELTNGRHLRIGTDEPERLCEVIAQMKAVTSAPSMP